MSYSKEELVRIYKIMQYAAQFDKTVARELRKGKANGFFHPGENQEAVDAGIISSIGPDVYLRPYHRGHSYYLLGDHKRFIASALGRATGYTRGIGGDYQAQAIEELHILPHCGLVGEDWVNCAGFAMGLKLQNKPGVVVDVQGDGAAQQGALYEAMNLASLFDLPIVFVVINNGVAMSTPTSSECKCSEISGRAAGFNVKGVTVYGQDPLAVREAMDAAIEGARNGQPAMVEIMTYRKCGHYMGDPKNYIDPAYDAAMIEKYPDPIPLYEKKLIDMGVCTEEELKGYVKEIKAEQTAAFEWCYEQPALTGDMLLGSHMVYSNTEGGKL